MINKEFTIDGQYGFHLRPAQVMVEKMSPFTCDVKMKKEDGTEADAKSILGLMSLGLNNGQKVQMETNGADEKKAMATLEELFRTNFGE
ncbi:MAG: HPr family phosphocarrier protein [Oscillospiraceae bacterium]|jgi:phosphotransferase system HPr (HPr) family protein|nr:HPr family phosphocarrier protein [Oscillospiraceae bacterium]